MGRMAAALTKLSHLDKGRGHARRLETPSCRNRIGAGRGCITDACVSAGRVRIHARTTGDATSTKQRRLTASVSVFGGGGTDAGIGHKLENRRSFPTKDPRDPVHQCSSGAHH